MNWATEHIEALKAWRTVTFRPKGSSMSGRIESGQEVTIAPVETVDEVFIDDIVLCTVQGKPYLHLVQAIRRKKENLWYLIANNRGRINGWTPWSKIYGKVVKVGSKP